MPQAGDGEQRKTARKPGFYLAGRQESLVRSAIAAHKKPPDEGGSRRQIAIRILPKRKFMTCEKVRLGATSTLPCHLNGATHEFTPAMRGQRCFNAVAAKPALLQFANANACFTPSCALAGWPGRRSGAPGFRSDRAPARACLPRQTCRPGRSAAAIRYSRAR